MELALLVCLATLATTALTYQPGVYTGELLW